MNSKSSTEAELIGVSDDNIERKEIKINYMTTEEMIADFFTKPLQ
eukprot:gene34146-44118_t